MNTNLQALADRAEIEDLVHRLGASLDERRFDDLRGILVEDATARTPGGLAEGRDAMVAQARRNHPVEDRIQHVISDVLIDLDGDDATVRANLVATFIRADATSRPHMVLGEVYRLHARRTADGWRLSSVETEPVWAAEPTAVDLGELLGRRPAQRA
jgi:hypothetical protein